ncbi:MAG: hypothetical protein Kow0058_06710 [Roseovarius sp.]
MIDRLVRLFRDQTGAVTVDWLVLSAAVMGLALAALGSVRAATLERAGTITADVEVGDGG